jgi:hypothetical protein
MPRSHNAALRAPDVVWAIVLRRGEEVRVIDGGASWRPDPQPDLLEGVVDFLDKASLPRRCRRRRKATP